MEYSEKINLFDETLHRFRVFLKNWHEKDKEVASRFNLFSILKIDWKEVIVHTPLLSNLLNPMGTHSQGDLFYNEFIMTVLPEKEWDFFLNITPEDLYVRDEESFEDGQIDIFIRHKNKIAPFVIIIENKIFAGDQYQQLTRYYNHAIKRLSINPEKVKLIYLTPIESMPGDLSIEKNLKDELIKSKTLLVISYQEHIIKWIKKCALLTKAPVVKYSLEQYLLTLESLFYG